uniref:CD63 antigen n=1 Tax=Aceria tosichella TaxID=561515 RepID=A0A6G1SP86_9ACAR
MATTVSSERGCFTSAMLLLARTIIILNCVTLAIVWLCLILSDDRTDILGNHITGTSLVEKISAGFMVAICFTGIRAAFTQDEKRLKIFALLITAFAIAEAGAASSKYLTRNRELASFELTFKLAEPQYKWYTNETNEATEWIDRIQDTLRCCGLKNAYSEWASFRPKNSTEETFPGSCCPQWHGPGDDKECSDYSIHQGACLFQYKAALHSVFIWLITSAVRLLFLAMLALWIAKHGESTEPSHEAPPVVSPSHFTQFQGPVYIRAPPTEQQPIVDEKPPTYVVANASALPSYHMS